MKDETIYNEEIYHTGNGQEPESNPDHIDLDTGEAVPFEATDKSEEEVVSEYLNKCNVNYNDEDAKNKHVNYDGLNN